MRLDQMNMVMTVKDRPYLTYQAVTTLRHNTRSNWNLTLVDDGSQPETRDLLKLFQATLWRRVSYVCVWPGRPESGVVGQLKNLGVKCSQEYFGRGDYLYLSDNDVYFTQDWDTKLIPIANDAQLVDYKLFGGQNHPYHKPVGEFEAHSDPDGRYAVPTGSERRKGFHEYFAVAGTSWLMPWETWDTYGPLDGNARGTGQSEDTAFCNRIREAGHKVGAMDPPVVLDTGITQTDGTLSVGHESKQQLKGVVYK